MSLAQSMHKEILNEIGPTNCCVLKKAQEESIVGELNSLLALMPIGSIVVEKDGFWLYLNDFLKESANIKENLSNGVLSSRKRMNTGPGRMYFCKNRAPMGGKER